MRKKIINLTSFLALVLLTVWGCVKDAKIDPASENGDIEKVAAWYQRQLIPTSVKGAFANVNSPQWSETKIEKRGDSTFFTTLLLRDSIITRELQVSLYDGAYEGVVRQYQFKSVDSLYTGSFTLNGRVIDLGVYNKEGRYTMLRTAGSRNIVLMGIEDIDGGYLPEVPVSPPPTNPGFPPSWPSYPPPPPPSYPPSYPPGGTGGGSGGGGGSSGTSNNGFAQINVGIKPCNFAFQPASGVNWQAAAVKGYKVYALSGGVNNTPVLLSQFDVEIGMPTFSLALQRTISTQEAKQLSSEAFTVAINAANLKYSLNNLQPAQIPAFVKTEMQTYINAQLGANLARVANMVGTNPGAGVKNYDANCK